MVINGFKKHSEVLSKDITAESNKLILNENVKVKLIIEENKMNWYQDEYQSRRN